jgi:chorismate synthase
VAGNSFGKLFNITTFGESHGPAIGVIVDGMPSGLSIDGEFIQNELARRRPGQSNIVTQRKEVDQVEILSGVFEGKSTGTPIGMIIKNKDAKSNDYSHIANKFRPSHADYTYTAKYGIRDYRGGGRSSARETAARVAAGALAKIFLNQYGIQIIAYVSQVGNLKMNQFDLNPAPAIIESNPVRCSDLRKAKEMEEYIKQIRKEGDTIGGVVNCVIKKCPVGLGSPVFDKLHAEIGKAMLSINAAKGFEYGSGFEGVAMKGSEHNDPFIMRESEVKTTSNFSGGIQGGISNGEDIYFRVAFKPVATIIQEQQSLDDSGQPTIVTGRGRHDPCVVPRAVPIVESMAALVIADFFLQQKSTKIQEV